MFDALEKKWGNTDQGDLINKLYQGRMKDYVKCLEVGFKNLLSLIIDNKQTKYGWKETLTSTGTEFFWNGFIDFKQAYLAQNIV